MHGGAYPIQGATIRLMETQSNGVWSTTTNSYKGTAKQLLQTTSDSTGFFTFPDTGWTCDANQYAYVTVTGGHTAATTNNNVIQIGVIGGCSADLANQGEIDNVNLFVSEPSTVAAAYALGNFISIDNTNAASGQQIVNITAPVANNSATPGCTGLGYMTSRPLTCVHAGLANGFANAYNLVDSVTYGANQFPSGVARTTVPNNSHGRVPREMINTLGNIMQSCVDSAGGAVNRYGSYTPGGNNSTRCGDFFYWATPPGQTTAPTNTLQAVLNIADYPTNNVDALFKLQPRAVFFTPGMNSDVLSGTTQTMAYTVSIFYDGTDVAGDTGMPRPVEVAVDENDNAFVLYGGTGNASYGAVTGFGPDGTGLFAGPHQSSITNPASIAMDSAGAAWVTNDALLNGNAYQINTPSTGGTSGAIGQTLPVLGGYAAGVALDMANNVWVVRDAQDLGQSLFRFNASNNYQANFFPTAPILSFPSKRLFVDYHQNVLGVSSNTDPLGTLLNLSSTQVYQFAYGSSNNAATLRYATLSATGGFDIAMSNSDVAYVPVTKQLNTQTGLANGQVQANGAGSYTGASSTGATYNAPMGVAMDGAGNLFWTEFAALGQIFKFVPTTAGSVTSGSLWSFAPCDSQGGQCNGASATYLRGMALDSSGAMWCVADGATGAVIQTLGYAAPTYPLLSYAHGGVIIQ